jgi:integrase
MPMAESFSKLLADQLYGRSLPNSPVLGTVWQAFDPVFFGEQETPMSNPNLTYHYFRPILVKTKLPQIRLYDLRHSCPTLLLIAEENPKVVSERLGRSTMGLTLDTYSHVLPTMQQNATAKLEKMLYSKSSSKQLQRNAR